MTRTAAYLIGAALERGTVAGTLTDRAALAQAGADSEQRGRELVAASEARRRARAASQSAEQASPTVPERQS